MRKLIQASNNHIFISGITRSGKTYFAAHALEQLPYGVLFFNIQDTELPTKFTKMNVKDVDLSSLKNALKKGHKIDLRFPADLNQATIFNIIGFVSREMLKAGFTEKDPIYIAYDECQLFRGDCLREIEMVATRGLYKGCRCMFITQRPAMASKTLYTQSFEQYIFRLSTGEKEYFKSKGIDFEKCQELWQLNGDHSYIYFNGIELKGFKAI